MKAISICLCFFISSFCALNAQSSKNEDVVYGAAVKFLQSFGAEYPDIYKFLDEKYDPTSISRGYYIHEEGYSRGTNIDVYRYHNKTEFSLSTYASNVENQELLCWITIKNGKVKSVEFQSNLFMENHRKAYVYQKKVSARHASFWDIHKEKEQRQNISIPCFLEHFNVFNTAI